MATKTHLTAQEEGVDESGIQVREDDPTSPVNGQIWINKPQRALKARIGGETIILTQGDPTSMEIPESGLLDGLLTNNFYKDTEVDLNLSVQNFVEGQKVYLLIKNIGLASITISFSGASFIIDENENGVLAAGATRMFTCIKIEDTILVTATEF